MRSVDGGAETPRVTPVDVAAGRSNVPAPSRTRVRGRQAERQQGRPTRASRSRIALQDDARLAQAELGPPRPEAFVDPTDLEPEQRALYRAAARGYLGPSANVRDRGRPRVEHASRRSRRRSRRPTRPRASSSPTAGRELRVLHLGTRHAGAPLLDPVQLRVRARAHRGVGAGTAHDRRRRRDRTGDRSATSPISKPHAPTRAAWITERVELVQELAADGARAGRRRLLGLPVHRRLRPVPGMSAMKKRLLPDIVSITPIELRRLRAVRAPLPQPPSARSARRAIRAPPNETGLLVHDMLRTSTRADRAPTRRTSPTCSPATPPTTTTSANSSSATRERCPSSDVTTARRTSSRSPASTGSRRRCSWPPRASTPYGCTTVCSTPATTRPGGSATSASPTIPRPRSRRSCSTTRRAKRGLRLRLRYEYLSADVTDDPDPWEPDADELVAIEEELRAAVERMRTNDEWQRRRRRRAVPHVLVPLDLPRQRRAAASRRGPCSAPRADRSAAAR